MLMLTCLRSRCPISSQVALAGVLAGALLLAACASPPAASPDPASIRRHSEASFEKLRQEEAQRKPAESPQEKEPGPSQLSPPAAQLPESQPQPQPQPSEDQSLTATGHGDLSKGPLICQRVADTAARAELAKLIRVTIKERAIDRVRERTGQPVEQDIEIVREELVNGLLQDVQIVDRRVDRSAGTCSSTAVMRRSTLIPLSPPSPLPIPLPFLSLSPSGRGEGEGERIFFPFSVGEHSTTLSRGGRGEG